MVQKLWHKMQRRSKRVGPYCRSQFLTLFLVLPGSTVYTRMQMCRYLKINSLGESQWPSVQKTKINDLANFELSKLMVQPCDLMQCTLLTKRTRYFMFHPKLYIPSTIYRLSIGNLTKAIWADKKCAGACSSSKTGILNKIAI